MVHEKEVYLGALALIEKEENWCKGNYARRADDIMTVFDSDDAAKWCVMGACYKIAGREVYDAEGQHDRFFPALYRAAKEMGTSVGLHSSTPVGLNDLRFPIPNHKIVTTLLKRALELVP